VYQVELAATIVSESRLFLKKQLIKIGYGSHVAAIHQDSQTKYKSN